MFFKIGPVEKDEKFSYMIVKHPDNIFERSAGPGRVVHGEFDEKKHIYEAYIENDSLQFLHTARQLNFSNYIHTRLSAICPHNLKGFDVIFRSALRRNNTGGEEISDEEFFALKMWRAEIGPFPIEKDKINFWFENAGLSCKFIPHYLDDGEIVSSVVMLKNKEGMSLSEFLQKIYLISYFLTVKHEMVSVKGDQIDKFVVFCKSWVEKLENRNRFINALCKYKSIAIEKFEGLLIDEGEDTEDEKITKRYKIDKFLNKIGLHAKRHKIVVDNIPETASTFIELGCGGGRLIRVVREKFPELNILGIEIKTKLAQKVIGKRRGKKKNTRVSNSNILFPNVQLSDLCPDYLACTEVIEHLVKQDRAKLIHLIKYLYMPKTFVLTTPNIEYNQFIEALSEGELRHPDHKIEFTEEEFMEEVVRPLSDLYHIEFIEVSPEEGIQPSWVIKGMLKETEEDRVPNEKILRSVQEVYKPFYLPISDYSVREKEIAGGFGSPAYNRNGENIFYLAPTMSPVEYFQRGKASQFLEHPEGVFDYFKKRTVDMVWEESKYMGSRGYILVFRDPVHAYALGYNAPIIVNSRGGFPFFEKKSELEALYAEILPKMDRDFIMLDSEIMPWKYKAKHLILEQFQFPAECAFLSRKNGSRKGIEAAAKFLKTLKGYSQDDPILIRAFSVLAKGMVNITDKRVGFSDVQCGIFKSRQWHYDELDKLESKILKPVERNVVNLTDETSRNSSVKRWQKFCDKGGEGFVYKTDFPFTYCDNGYLLQHEIKVRGDAYLQLVYGIDYKDLEYFKIVRWRNVVKKRRQVIQQYELSINILRSWLSRNREQLQRYIAGFIGMENVSVGKIDATL